MKESIPARGFGPGLPAEGAAVTVRLAGERLRIDGWPELGEVRKSQLVARRQGDGLVLEWDAAGGRCALAFDAKVGAGATAEIRHWLPATGVHHDAATRGWLWGALFLLVGLPLLLLALFFGFRGEIVDFAVARIPVAQEQALADSLWRMQRTQLRLIEGTAANRFVEEVGARLVAARPTPYAYRFHLADDRTVNAFAMPAGYIVVQRGLIEKAATAEEVAGVLAHEIEHVEQRHSLRGVVQAVGLAALWAAVSGDIAGGMAGQWLQELAGLHFSREQEAAADAGGYARLVAAHIDPRGMARFFATLAAQQAQLPGALNMLSTHPASDARAARLNDLLKDAPTFPPLMVDWPAIQAAAAQ